MYKNKTILFKRNRNLSDSLFPKLTKGLVWLFKWTFNWKIETSRNLEVLLLIKKLFFQQQKIAISQLIHYQNYKILFPTTHNYWGILGKIKVTCSISRQSITFLKVYIFQWNLPFQYSLCNFVIYSCRLIWITVGVVWVCILCKSQVR